MLDDSRGHKRTSLHGVAPVLSTPVQLYPGGKLIDPTAELEALLKIDPAEEMAPLFRDPRSNRPLRVAVVRETVKRVAAAAGLNPEFFGTSKRQVALCRRYDRSLTPHSTAQRRIEWWSASHIKQGSRMGLFVVCARLSISNRRPTVRV